MAKKTIPYTVTNSFFYIEDSAEPLEFQAIPPEKVNIQPKSENEPKKDFDFMKQFRDSIKNL